jgi:serine protease AprX
MKLATLWSPPLADQNLTPNTLITDAQGDINYGTSSWSQSTWSTAPGALSADFARSSWSCVCGGPSGTVGTSTSSWSTSSWSTYFGQ